MQHDGRKLGRVTAATTVGLLCCAGAAGAIPACGYDVEIVAFDCGGVFGTTPTFGNGLAPDGTVVGSYWDCELGSSGEHAFVWPPGGGMQIVPYPPAVYSMELFDANDAGQAVGTLFEEDGYWSEAFRLDKGKVIPLGVLPGADASEALAVNTHGFAVGWSGTIFMGTTPRSAVLWQPGGRIVNLAPDLRTPKSEARDVNELGQVTGWMGTGKTLDAKAFIWDASKVIELPLLSEAGALTTEGRAINSHQDVVGYGRLPNPTFGFDARAYLYIDRRVISIALPLGYTDSEAVDVNDAQQVIGAFSADNRPIVWFLWDNGFVYSLNGLIHGPVGLQIELLTSINDAGVISGMASTPGGGGAIRLIPRFAKVTDLDCDGVVGPIDLQVLLEQWGDCLKKASCVADLDADGNVDGFDLAMILADWS